MTKKEFAEKWSYTIWETDEDIKKLNSFQCISDLNALIREELIDFILWHGSREDEIYPVNEIEELIDEYLKSQQ